MDLAELQVPWVEDRIADGSIECVWALVGGGRLVIGVARSVEDFRAMLTAGPDSPSRVWTQLTEIQDALGLLRDRLHEHGRTVPERLE